MVVLYGICYLNVDVLKHVLMQSVQFNLTLHYCISVCQELSLSYLTGWNLCKRGVGIRV